MSKSFKLDGVVDVNADYYIAGGMGSQDKYKFEVEIIRETDWIDKKPVPVIWVDVHKNWIQDNDRAFDEKRTQMFYNVEDVCKHLKRIFNLHHKTQEALLKYEMKHSAEYLAEIKK